MASKTNLLARRVLQGVVVYPLEAQMALMVVVSKIPLREAVSEAEGLAQVVQMAAAVVVPMTAPRVVT